MSYRTPTCLLVAALGAAVLVLSSARALADPPLKAKVTPPAVKAQIEPQSEPVKPGGEKPAPEQAKTYPIPDWVHDSSWYQIDVRRFRNGDTSNDPSVSLPWTADPQLVRRSISELTYRMEAEGKRLRVVWPMPFGGDLQGLRAKLGYLQKLGVDTLYTSDCFLETDGRHAGDSLGVADSSARLTGETDDPATWRFSETDKLFLGFLTDAHKRGLRVVVDAIAVRRLHRSAENSDKTSARERLTESEAALISRWMDPNRDGDPSDGVDGWAYSNVSTQPWNAGKAFREYVKTLNPNAVVVKIGHPLLTPKHIASDFDVMINYSPGELIRHWLIDDVEGTQSELRREIKTLEAFDEALRKSLLQSTYPGLARPILPVRGPDQPNLDFLRGMPAQDQKLAEADFDRRRLALALLHLYYGSPMIRYGDEVGMSADGSARSVVPMWWNDLPDAHTKSPDYRGDFLALYRMLNALRVQFAPLRRGDVRTVLLDDGKKVMAFARTLPGDEVIVVMNFGDKSQHVALPTGMPGQLVKVVNPQLKPEAAQLAGRPKPPPIDPKEVARLRVGGSRVKANERGEILVWVAPMSVRLVLVSDR